MSMPDYKRGIPKDRHGLSSEYTVIRLLKAKEESRNAFQELHSHTKVVHISGFPFAWAIKMIIEQAPNIQAIEVIPSMLEKFSNSACGMCEKKGIEIRGGYSRPHLAWRGKQNRSPSYDTQRSSFVNLEEEQKKLFDELLALGVKEALITSRYYCLSGESFISQREVAQEFGLSKYAGNIQVSRYIKAVIHYLDPEFEVSQHPLEMANNLKIRVLRLRQISANAASRDERIKEYTAEVELTLPDKFPLSRLDALKAVVRAKNSGALSILKESRQRALLLRFGIEDGKYKTLQKVGDLMGVTRERARQCEEKALALLNITE